MHLAKIRPHEKIKATELASKLEIPRHFLSQILHNLSKLNLISSQKGPGGGFYLNEEQRKNSPFDIITALQGEDYMQVCIYDTKPCKRNRPCPFHEVYSSYKSGFIRSLSTQSLEDLAKGMK